MGGDNFSPISNDIQHQEALARLSDLMDKEFDIYSDEAVELNLLALMIEAYEKEHYHDWNSYQ